MFKFPFSFFAKSLLCVGFGLGSVVNQAMAQNTGVISGFDKDSRPLLASVPFLNIALDSRATGMGDAGVATSPDANSVYWNAAKLAFTQDKFSASLTYNPWLQNLGVSDMFLTSLSGYYKRDDKQAFGAEIRYFNLGDIQFTDGAGQAILDFVPRETAFALSYARKLSSQFSMSVTGRFINSNLTGDFSNGGLDAKPGRSISADIGFFYVIPSLKLGKKDANLNFGANISNIGQKMSYVNDGTTDFLPGNLRLGSALTLNLDPLKKNQLTFALDMNKLLIPSPAQYDSNGKYVKGDTTSKSLISGTFGSFGDAPEGFKEELQEIILSGGMEYWYNQTFAARVGYFNEHKNKGNRKYFTVGAGFRSKLFAVDVSYIIPPPNRSSALDGTIRFTLIGYFGNKEKTTTTTTEE